MMSGLHKAWEHLAHAFRDDFGGDAGSGAKSESSVLSELALPWHGDHWQSMLACPMDARRYLLEDWSVTTDNTPDDDMPNRIDSFSGRRVRSFS